MEATISQMPGPYRVIAQCLMAPVQLTDLALIYGLDLEALTVTSNSSDHTPTVGAAVTELQTLKGIQKFLETNRPKIRYSGESFIVPLIRIPTRLLSIERDRLGVMERRGKRRAHNYTNPQKPEMFRCPIPGCAGSAVNLACIKAAMNSHCNVFHKDPPVVYTFHVEFARSWDTFTYPARSPTLEEISSTPPAGSPVVSPDSQPHAERESTGSNVARSAAGRASQTVQERPSVSALRLSLQAGLPPASSTHQLEFFSRDDETIRGTGVYAFPKTGPAAEGSYGCTPLEIGTRNVSRDAWARDLGTGQVLPNSDILESAQENIQNETDDSNYHPSQEPSQVQTEVALSAPATLIDPVDFQTAILAMQPPPVNNTE